MTNKLTDNLSYNLAKKTPDNVKHYVRKLEEKVWTYKQIEQELGIELSVLVKAIKNGIFEGYFTFDEPVKFLPDLNNKCFYMLGHCDGPDLYYYFKDYGKTWALTREELK